jgi:hypothetical protein
MERLVGILTCWNPSWIIVVHNVALAIGMFFQAYLKEVGFTRIARAF